MTESPKQNQSKTDLFAKEIGLRLQQARSGLGLSQEDLHQKTKLNDSDGIGISRAVLSLYERGINKPGSREIKILCLTLKISSNWLLFGSESPAHAIQPSLVFLQGDELTISIRLALGLAALEATEREALSTIIFSMLTKSLGDYQLSSLMYIASSLAPALKEKITDYIGNEADNLSVADLIEKFVNEASNAHYTNYGTLRPLISDDDLPTFDLDNPPPPRNLKPQL